MKKLLISLTLFLLLLWPVDNYAQEKIYLPIILSSGRTIVDNNWRLITPLGAQNRILNPSGEIAGNFAATGAAAVSRVTTYQKYGLYSYEIVSAGNDGISLTTTTLAASDHYFSVRVRGSSRDNLRVTIGTATKLLTLIEKIDSRWNLYAVGFASAEVSGQTAVEITSIQAETFYIDGVQLEAGPLTTYIDGTQEGCGWLGTAHASVSERSGESKAGGESVKFWEEYNFQIEKVIGAGASSHRLGIDQYAILPGGELNSDKILPREFTIVGQFIADSEPEIHDKMASLEADLTSNDNQLVLLRFNGSRVQKEIAARYVGGLEGDMPVVYCDKVSIQDNNWLALNKFTQKAAIQLTAPYPYWQEVGESAAVLDTNDSATFRIVAGRLRATGQWDDLGPPDAAGTYTHAWAIVENDQYVYFGGDFLNFDNIAAADYIVRYNKNTGDYSALDVGLNGIVYALALAPNGDLYIGGAFTNAGGVAAADYLCYWDGTNFNAVGTPNTGAAAITNVRALAFDLDGNLYIGGSFVNWADIANADYVVMWDGTNYSALSTGTDAEVDAIAIGLDNIIYLGGNFTVPDSYVTSWTGSAFASLSTGTNAHVDAIVCDPHTGIIYFGGNFTTAGPIDANRIVAWNGTSFLALGDGLNTGGIFSLAIKDNNLYTGGTFVGAGDLTIVNRVARWNGSAWAHLDIDLPGAPTVYGFLASQYTDPVIKQNYDLFVAFDTTGTGYYAGLVTIDNEGTVQAFPKIVYSRSGGISAILETLRNERTGKEILFDYSLLDGETLTIDLTPTKRSIVSSMFGSRLDAYLPGSDFGQWSLLPNDNDVTSFVAEGGGPTVTSYMLWREAFSSY